MFYLLLFVAGSSPAGGTMTIIDRFYRDPDTTSWMYQFPDGGCAKASIEEARMMDEVEAYQLLISRIDLYAFVHLQPGDNLERDGQVVWQTNEDGPIVMFSVSPNVYRQLLAVQAGASPQVVTRNQS